MGLVELVGVAGRSGGAAELAAEATVGAARAAVEEVGVWSLGLARDGTRAGGVGVEA